MSGVTATVMQGHCKTVFAASDLTIKNKWQYFCSGIMPRALVL